MSGFVGINKNASVEDVDQMLAKVQYRGPDGLSSIESDGWALGLARMTVLDVGNGDQPMVDKESGARIVHNGEIYNYRKLREELGGKFQTDCDTEVLLRLHRSGQKPEEWLNRLDGMFAFAIVDDDGLLLARDPMGIKPLYVGKKGEQIIFGSEIKAVLERTDRIMEFPPGHVYTTKGGGRPYRTLDYELPCTMEVDEIAGRLLELVTDAVHARMVANVPLGVFLSGGISSSILTALANQFSPNVKTFAVGMEGSDDIVAAREGSKHIGTNHFERIFTLKEAVEVLPKVIFHLESFDSGLVRSAIANYFLCELASQQVKVALSGEGADELFAGHTYLSAMHGSALRKELREITEALHYTGLQRCDRMSSAHGLEVRVPYIGNLEMVEFALSIPVQYKLEPKKHISKWILRKAVEGLLPESIVWRKKVRFADGTGLGNQLGQWAEASISDEQFERHKERYAGFEIRSKEEMAYFLIFRRLFPAHRISALVGRSKVA